MSITTVITIISGQSATVVVPSVTPANVQVVANTPASVQVNTSQGLPGATGDTGPQGPAGADGATGSDGLSAYQIAVSNGFIGTEAEWLISLQGADGAQGIQGIQGDPGAAGATGPAGPGLPAGGVAGQIIKKSSGADYATEWVAPQMSLIEAFISAQLPAEPIRGHNIYGFPLNAGYGLAVGNVYLIPIIIPEKTTITGVLYQLHVAGVFVDPSIAGRMENSISLYKIDPINRVCNRIAITENNPEIWRRPVHSFQKKAFISSIECDPGAYWVAFVWNATSATTSPQLKTAHSAVSNTNQYAFEQAPTYVRYGGRYTSYETYETLPMSSIIAWSSAWAALY